MEGILVKTQVDRTVFSDFSRFHNFTYGRRGLSLALFPILMVGFALMNGLSGSMVLGTVFALLGILMPLGYLLFYRRGVANQIKRFGLGQKKLAYSVLLDDTGLHVQNGEESIDYSWEHTYGAYRVASYCYLYVTKAQCFILPTCDIQGGKGSDDLWALLVSHMGKYRTKSYVK